LDTSGSLFVAEFGANSVLKISPSGIASLLASGQSGVRQLAFNPSGDLFAANYETETIARITPAGAVSTFATGVLGGGLAVEPVVPPPRITSIQRLSNGHILVRGICSPNNSTTVLEASSNLAPGSFAFFASVVPDPAGMFSIEDSTTSSLMKRFYRLLSP